MFENFNDVYKMTSNPLGFCVIIIINMINFEKDEKDQLETSHSIQSVHLITFD